MRRCDGCAADETECELPELRAYRGLLLCTECQKWQVSAPVQPREIITRARYRAAWRHRQAQQDALGRVLPECNAIFAIFSKMA